MLIYTFTYPTDEFEHIPGCCDLKSPYVKVNIISLWLKSSIVFIFHKEKTFITNDCCQTNVQCKTLNPLKQGNHKNKYLMVDLPCDH